MRATNHKDNIALNIEANIFSKPLCSMILPAREMIKFVTSTNQDNRLLFEKMRSNIKKKVESYGASLEEIYVLDKKKYKLTYRTCDKLMHKLLAEDLKAIFKVKIRNKNYEYLVE